MSPIVSFTFGQSMPAILDLAWAQSFGRTTELIVSSILIAGVIGGSAAWAHDMLDRRHAVARWTRRISMGSLLAVALTPLIVHAAIWEQTLGKFGWIIPAAGRSVDPQRWFQTTLAVAWIHGTAAAGLVFGFLKLGMSRLPRQTRSMANLEAGPVRSWFTVLLPAAKPSVFTAVTLISLIAATEMTVVDLYAVVTVAERFYLFFAAQPNVAAASMVFLPSAVGIAAGIWFVRWRANGDGPANSFDQYPSSDERRHQAATVTATPLTQWFVAGWLWTIVATLIGVPIYATGLKLGLTAEGWNAGMIVERLSRAPTLYANEWRWTMAVAIGAAVVANGLAALIVTKTMDRRGRVARRWIEPALWTAFCIPGPLVGLIVVRVFQLDFPGAEVLATRTLIPLWIATNFRTLPIAYAILRFSIDGIPSDVRQMATVEHAPHRRLRYVYLPLLWTPLAASLVICGIVAAGDVAVTLPVAPAGVTTMATRLFGLLHSGARYPEAVLTVLYVVTMGGSFLLPLALSRRYRGRSRSLPSSR